MVLAIKSTNTTIELTACYQNDAGEAANPDTSAKIRVYPANSDTETVSETDMTQKDSETGYYKHVWDITSIAAGYYIAFFKFVDAGKTITTQQSILILDTL
jgi:hypothetical protein